MTATPIRKVVIAGRDAAAWLAANALIRAFGPGGLAVEVVELPSLLRPQDVVTARPTLEAFHRLLDLDEYEILKATAGTYSLGQSFVNFSGTRPPFLHPYGSHGIALGNVAFHQLWIKARQGGLQVDFEHFSLTAAAALRGRFFAGNRATSDFRTDYGYALNAAAYVQALKGHALRRGVLLTPARHVEAALDAHSGDIRALVLGDGREISGDLFIDATGPKSLLLGQALAQPLEDWSGWFPGNRLMAASGERLKSLPPFTQVRALHAGVLHVVPLQDMTGLVYAYDNVASSDEQALQDIAVIAGVPLRPDATVNPLLPGRRAAAWRGNCVALGEAACVFDPVDSPNLHAIQLGLAHLITLFPVDTHCAGEADEYNRIVQTAFERFRDFQIGHFKLNRLQDNLLWDYLRNGIVPDALAYKIALFEARGVASLLDEETFTADDWLSIFIGHGLVPRSYDPRVDLVAQDAAIRHVQGILSFIREQVQSMDSHDAYLELFASRDFA